MPIVGSGGPITFSTGSPIRAGSWKARSMSASSSTAPRISAAASGISPLATGSCDTPKPRMTFTARRTVSWGWTYTSGGMCPPRAADEQALLGGDAPGHEEAVLVADRDHPVDQRRVVGGGPEVLADALDQ